MWELQSGTYVSTRNNVPENSFGKLKLQGTYNLITTPAPPHLDPTPETLCQPQININTLKQICETLFVVEFFTFVLK